MYNKKGGKVLGKGRDGCVSDQTILCSKKSNPDHYKDMVSKIIDVSQATPYEIKMFVNEFESGEIFRNYDPKGTHFLPGLEMCYKKFHELNPLQKKDLINCNYNVDDYESLYLNILLKKGISFDKITKDLGPIDFLKSLSYLLIGAQNCVYDLNILLLDIKPDNLLYSEDNKNILYPVFIDFSDDFVIKNNKDLQYFINGFSSYYDTWTLEMFYAFYIIRNMNGKNSKKLINDVYNYRKIDMIKLHNNKKYSLLNVILKLINNKLSKKELQLFYEKQMVYSIGISFFHSFDNSSKKKELYKYGIDKILSGLINEFYFDRLSIDDAMKQIIDKLNEMNYLLQKREDYFINLNNNKSLVKKSINKNSLDFFKNNILSKKSLKSNNVSFSLPKTPNFNSIKNNNKNILSKQIESMVNDMKLVSKKEISKRKSKKISKSKKLNYNSKNLSKLTKKQLISKIKVYKRKFCNKNINLMKKKQFIQNLNDYDSDMYKIDDLKKYSYFQLKSLYKNIYNENCKVNYNDRKSKLVDFIKKHNL